jgi:hypothetical protein
LISSPDCTSYQLSDGISLDLAGREGRPRSLRVNTATLEMPSTDLFHVLHHAALGAPFCSTPFHTPNGAVCEQYTCRHQFDSSNNSAEQPLVLLDCITTPPTTWRYDFVHTFVVAEDDIANRDWLILARWKSA